MELVKVVVEMQDRFGPEGKAKVAEARRWATAPVGLPRKRVETMAAVRGDYGASMLKRAAETALLRVVGPREKWGEWEALVVSAELVGSVCVEEVSK